MEPACFGNNHTEVQAGASGFSCTAVWVTCFMSTLRPISHFWNHKPHSFIKRIPLCIRLSKMVQQDLGKWITRGCQRRLVVKKIRKPMTSHDIYRLCQKKNPSIRPQHVFALLSEMIQKRVVCTVNKRRGKGRLYYLTELGISLVQEHFDKHREPVDKSVDWELFGELMTASLRTKILFELAQPTPSNWSENTPRNVQRRLRATNPTSVTSVSRLLKRLEEKELVACIGFRKKRSQKLYDITEKGKCIVGALQKYRGAI